MILGQEILIELGLNLKFSEHVIESDDGTFNGSTTTMVDLGMYIFKDLNTGNIKPEEQFTNVNAEEVYESDHLRTSTKKLLVILDYKYEKSDLHKVKENQCQHLTTTKLNELLKLLQKFEDFFDGTIGTWKIDQVDSELKENAKPIFSRPYPVPKVHQ